MQTNETPEGAPGHPEGVPVLTPAERKALKARAHHLAPVVMIGEAGLTDAVLAEARKAVEAHELVKIRVLGDDRELRTSFMARLCAEVPCAPVQMIGKLLVVYRPRPTEAAERPRGPHLPKKIAAVGGKVVPRRRVRKETEPSAADAPRKRIWSTEATGRPTTRSAADARGRGRGDSRGKPGFGRTGGRAGSIRGTGLRARKR